MEAFRRPAGSVGSLAPQEDLEPEECIEQLTSAQERIGLIEKLGALDRTIAFMQVYVDFARAIGHRDAEKTAAHLDELRARHPTE